MVSARADSYWGVSFIETTEVSPSVYVMSSLGVAVVDLSPEPTLLEAWAD